MNITLHEQVLLCTFSSISYLRYIYKSLYKFDLATLAKSYVCVPCRLHWRNSMSFICVPYHISWPNSISFMCILYRLSSPSSISFMSVYCTVPPTLPLKYKLYVWAVPPTLRTSSGNLATNNCTASPLCGFSCVPSGGSSSYRSAMFVVLSIWRERSTQYLQNPNLPYLFA